MFSITTALFVAVVITNAAARGPPPKNCNQAQTVKFTFTVNGPFVLANGSLVNNPATGTGVRIPFAVDIYSVPGAKAIGFDTELCSRLDDHVNWYCYGTITNLNGCTGKLNFAGPFTDATSTGDFVITGGTGDFDRARGHITETLDPATGKSDRTAYILF